jgi:GNAT superfamily N-acetyltransferase
MSILFLTQELAAKVEMSETMAAVECAESVNAHNPGSAAVEPIAGGYAIYTGPDSPITQAVGLGMNGPVAAAEFDKLENFYFSRNEPCRIETCPLADLSLFTLYGERGYRATEFSSVLAHPVDATATFTAVPGVEIRRAAPHELRLWAETVAQGFADEYPVTPELIDVISLFSTGKTSECYFACIDNQIAGGGTVAIRDKVAGLFGASTLPQFRRRGVQTALLHHRLRRAAESGCDVAVSLTRPASISERNILRNNFRVLYTRIKFERPVPATRAT